MIVYPYESVGSQTFLPLISFNIFFCGKRADALGLIDSGASISIFKEEIAEQLALILKKARV